MTGKPSPVVVTKSERLLSWILAGFLLLALSWAYVNIDDKVTKSRADEANVRFDATMAIHRAEEQYASSLGLQAGLSDDAIYEVEADVEAAKENRDDARERYRTTVDEGDADPELKRKYVGAESRVAVAVSKQRRLVVRQRAAKKNLREYQREHRAEEQTATERLDSFDAATDRITFILRLLMALLTLGLSVWLLRWVTERSPRAQPLAQAGVIAGGLILLTLIIDYGEISFDFATVGPLGMALLGISLSVAAFLGLQRYLRKSLPNRRLRDGECADCGYPGGTSSFCESCGSQLRTACDSCGQLRRTGVEHCGACGAA